MKKAVKLSAMLLMFILTCNLSLTAQRGMRETTDSTRTHTMRMIGDTNHMRGMGGNQFVGHRQWGNNERGMGPGSMRDMGRGFGQPGRDGRGPEGMMLASIPNVTEKQKKEIADLKLKQQDEMKKLREEMQTKMLAMRDSHNKSIMNILTDEQKKFIESKEVKNVPVKHETVPAIKN